MTPPIWSVPARRDLAEIDEFYQQIDRRIAERMARAAVGAATMLAENPHVGTPVPETGLRKWRVKQTPYLLLYRSKGDTVLILCVIHAARDWQRQL